MSVRKPNLKAFSCALLVLFSLVFTLPTALPNRPDGTEPGPDVTVTDNGNGTVTLANGIVSLVIVKKTSRVDEVTYTYDTGEGKRTSQMLQGKGQYYYGGFMLGNGSRSRTPWRRTRRPTTGTMPM